MREPLDETRIDQSGKKALELIPAQPGPHAVIDQVDPAIRVISHCQHLSRRIGRPYA